MKKTTKILQSSGKYAWLLAGSMMVSGPVYAHDYYSNAPTVNDCIHGNTGSDVNLDCTRNRSDRNTDDTNAYNTDTGVLDGSKLIHSNSGMVASDGMTAQSSGR